MSLIKCPKCGESFPNSYVICPFCKQSFYNSDKVHRALEILLDGFEYNHSEKNIDLINHEANVLAEKIVLNNFSTEYVASAKQSFDEFVSKTPLLIVSNPDMFEIKDKAEIYLGDKKRILRGKILLGIKCKTDSNTTVVIPEGVTHISGIYKKYSFYDKEDGWDYRWVIERYCFDAPLKKVVIPASLSHILSSAFSKEVVLPIDCDHMITCASSCLKINFLNENAALFSRPYDYHVSDNLLEYTDFRIGSKEYINGQKIETYFGNRDYIINANTTVPHRFIQFINTFKSICVESELSYIDCYTQCPVFYKSILPSYPIHGKITYLCCDSPIEKKLQIPTSVGWDNCTLVVPSEYYYYDYLSKTSSYHHLTRVIVDNKVLTTLTIPAEFTQYRIWNEDINLVKIEDGSISIPENAFDDCKKLQTVFIPNSVKTIGVRAFEGCEKLKNITIPDSVTTIGDYAFYGCDSLTSIEVPNSVTAIGDYAFAGCERLKSLIIPDSVEKIRISTQVEFLHHLEHLSLPIHLDETLDFLSNCDDLKVLETHLLISSGDIRNYNACSWLKPKITFGEKMETIFMLCPAEKALSQVNYLKDHNMFDLKNDLNVYFNDGTSLIIKAKNAATSSKQRKVK